MTAIRTEVWLALASVLCDINSMSDNQWRTQRGWGQLDRSSPYPSKTQIQNNHSFF
jgi:hypothetical protein